MVHSFMSNHDEKFGRNQIATWFAQRFKYLVNHEGNHLLEGGLEEEIFRNKCVLDLSDHTMVS